MNHVSHSADILHHACNLFSKPHLKFRSFNITWRQSSSSINKNLSSKISFHVGLHVNSAVRAINIRDGVEDLDFGKYFIKWPSFWVLYRICSSHMTQPLAIFWGPENSHQMRLYFFLSVFIFYVFFVEAIANDDIKSKMEDIFQERKLGALNLLAINKNARDMIKSHKGVKAWLKEVVLERGIKDLKPYRNLRQIFVQIEASILEEKQESDNQAAENEKTIKGATTEFPTKVAEPNVLVAATHEFTSLTVQDKGKEVKATKAVVGAGTLLKSCNIGCNSIMAPHATDNHIEDVKLKPNQPPVKFACKVKEGENVAGDSHGIVLNRIHVEVGGLTDHADLPSIEDGEGDILVSEELIVDGQTKNIPNFDKESEKRNDEIKEEKGRVEQPVAGASEGQVEGQTPSKEQKDVNNIETINVPNFENGSVPLNVEIKERTGQVRQDDPIVTREKQSEDNEVIQTPSEEQKDNNNIETMNAPNFENGSEAENVDIEKAIVQDDPMVMGAEQGEDNHVGQTHSEEQTEVISNLDDSGKRNHEIDEANLQDEQIVAGTSEGQVEVEGQDDNSPQANQALQASEGQIVQEEPDPLDTFMEARPDETYTET
ncbi:hypothetical protein ROZALSC1DRAFT_24085, partial [Rozella allomycis CSF55]